MGWQGQAGSSAWRTVQLGEPPRWAASSARDPSLPVALAVNEPHSHAPERARDDTHRGPRQSGPRLIDRRGVRTAGIVVLAVLLVGGVLWWLHERRYESTDDAFIDAHIIHVAPRVAGQIVAVLVNDNQAVTTGEPLVRIDVAPAHARLEQTLAQRAQAATAVTQAEAQARASEAQYRQSLANLRSARAQTFKAESDLRRYRMLRATTPQAVSQQQLDAARATTEASLWQMRDAEVSLTAEVANDYIQLRAMQARIQIARDSIRSHAEDALARYADEQQHLGELRQAQSAAAASLVIARAQYAAGLVTFINVLQASATELGARDQVEQSTQALAQDLVSLYKALGGGWDHPPLESRDNQ
jgi:multidrug efflux pump subunit AcrA (membrane-fusion protein)